MKKNRFGDKHRLRIKANNCVYCGELANTEEHFPPASVSLYGLLIPACRECNLLAGTDFAFEFEPRTVLVNLKLRNKYKRFIKAPHWSEEELEELSYNLATGVAQWEVIKSVIMKRIAWNAIAYMASIDHNNYFAQFCARIDTITKYEKNNLERLNDLMKKSEMFDSY